MKPILRLCNLLSIMLCAGAAHAQVPEYPNKPVKFWVALAGGAPDTVARLLTERLTTLGQPFIVENRPGAGGSVVASQLARLTPDGYTLLVADTGQIVVPPQIETDAGYAPKDFSPVSMIATIPLYILTNPHSPAGIGSFADLIKIASAKPGVLNYGSAGIASIHHVTMEAIKKDLRLNIVHVPYKGSGQSIAALIGGEVPLVVGSLSAISGFVQSGQAKLLAVTSLKRAADRPDIPAVSEFIKGFNFVSEIGLIGPQGLPSVVTGKLSAAIKTITEQPDFQGRLQVIGASSAYSGPADYADNIRTSFVKYGEALKAAGLINSRK